VAGAIAAAVLALAPVVVDYMRTTVRARSFEGGVP
jgi:hypothetical protein